MQNNIPQAVQEYLSAYCYKIELHAHTMPGSICGELTPKDMIQRLQGQQYDAVVITNHFYEGAPFMKAQDPVATYLEDYYATKEEGAKKGIQVLLGAEYRFTENVNDYLVYGVDEAMLRETVTRFDMGIEAFYREYHRQDRLILQAHPFRNGMTMVQSEYLDGIETMNMHPNHNSRVAVANRYARQKEFPVTVAGTDLHHPGHEGCCALRAKVLPETEGQLVELLRSRDYLFEIGGHPMLPYVGW